MLRNLLLFIILFHPALQNLNARISGNSILAIWSPFGIISILTVYFSLIYFIIKKGIILKGLFIFRPFFLLLCVAFFSIFVSDFSLLSLRDFIELFSIFVIYVLSANLFDTQKRLKTLVKVIVASSLIPLMVAFYQIFSKTGGDYGEIMRVQGTFSHPNEFAFYLLLTFPFLMENIFEKNDNGNSALNIPVLFLFSISLFAFKWTYTRGAWFAFILELIILWFLSRRRILPLLGIASILGMVFAAPDVLSRITEGFSQSSSFSWRIETWKAMFAIALKRPFLGYGIGSSASMYEKFVYILAVPHNDYLRIFFEMGAIALVIYIWLWFSILSFGWHFYRGIKSNSFITKVGAAFISVVVAFMTISIADNFFNNSLLLWSFLCLAGALEGFYRKNFGKQTQGTVSQNILF